jgi:murein DD-endopeptidase MepM/ murein hydrolase activator NlpD
MQKNKFYFSKILLITGVGLTCLVVLEAHQKMLGASAGSKLPQSLQRILSEKPAIAPNAKSDSISTPQRLALAVDVGSSSDPTPNVSRLNSDQIRLNAWAGSSFPVENFQAYTSPFGYRQSATGGFNQEFHYGLDMAAPQGSYVRNWWTGKVVEVSDNTNCGTSVVVESGKWLHIYCHMQGHVETADGKRYMIDREGGILVVEGQTVLAGQRVGRVGMTGRTTGPHLHWGLKYEGNWVDPALVLRAMYAGQQNTAQLGSN